MEQEFGRPRCAELSAEKSTGPVCFALPCRSAKITRDMGEIRILRTDRLNCVSVMMVRIMPIATVMLVG